ncbi:MAG TPA: hypothetical protein VFE47_03625 [Tepidisphaeraceae bacterium]|jgi:hypothetical protein|nr:hypothetical protein [Tepidisphaeraceae bacterium]
MTIEEAIRVANRFAECFVVWRTDTGEIVSVEAAGSSKQPDPNRNMKLLSEMGSKGTFPTKGRFLPVAMVTRELLQHEADECTRLNRRSLIFNQWSAWPPARLIEILERREFERPFVDTGDAHIILDHMFDLQADELIAQPALLERFRALSRPGLLDERAGLRLAIGLAVLDNVPARLKAMYRGKVFRSNLWDFIDAFGDVRTEDPEIIAELIDVVERSVMFGPRRHAMMALGKIGPAAGSRAVDALRTHIFDSSPEVTSSESWSLHEFPRRRRRGKSAPPVIAGVCCEPGRGLGLARHVGRWGSC